MTRVLSLYFMRLIVCFSRRFGLSDNTENSNQRVETDESQQVESSAGSRSTGHLTLDGEDDESEILDEEGGDVDNNNASGETNRATVDAAHSNVRRSSIAIEAAELKALELEAVAATPP